MNNHRTGILASGKLGEECLKMLHAESPVCFVLTDKLSEGIRSFCEQQHIPLFTGNPRGGKATGFIRQHPVDVILSVNYLFIVESDIISHPSQYAINFHGSLLPRYRGRTPHVWSIINNETETGITAHLITEGCDEGDIICQERIPIGPDDTGSSLLGIFNSRYPAMINKVMQQIRQGEVKPIKQDETRATWFGKRTPEDGLINWSWQKERIRNWVRAQASPYPGAFSYVNGSKLTIHKIAYSEMGFTQDNPDGYVIRGGTQPIIKTPNGCVALLSFNRENGETIDTGDILT